MKNGNSNIYLFTYMYKTISNKNLVESTYIVHTVKVYYTLMLRK